MKAINSLKKYVKLDYEQIEPLEDSDFRDFCLNHDEDINELIGCVEEIKAYVEEIKCMSMCEFENEKAYSWANHIANDIQDIYKKYVD